MEPITIIQGLNSEVLEYSEAGTHDRETLERFSMGYSSILSNLDEPALHLISEMSEGFSLLIHELADEVFTETDTGATLWQIVLDCWNALGDQHSDSKPLAKSFNELTLYTFREDFRNVWAGLHIHIAASLSYRSSY